MKTSRIKNNKLNVKALSIFTLVSIFTFIFVYIYSYQLSISHAASIQDMESQISEMESQISEIESQIVAKKREINKDLAFEKGFKPVKDIVFIKKSSTTALNERAN